MAVVRITVDPTQILPCPWCATGQVDFCEGATVETWFTVQTTGLLERLVRPARLAVCNSCEFAIEVSSAGVPVRPLRGREEAI